MNRLIKFRGLPIGGKSFVYGYYRHVYIPNWCGKTPYNVHKIYDPETRIEHDVHEKSVAQYIGLSNELEQELYEGDILSHPNSVGLLKIVFRYGSYKLKAKYPLIDIGHAEFCKVVGNDFESPELLQLESESEPCDRPCGPSDYYKGGKCDKNGCYE